MANGKFVPNHKGMADVLNNREIFNECDTVGAYVCGKASSAGHGSYAYDTIYGARRVHTRVKTGDDRAFYTERNTHALERAARRR